MISHDDVGFSGFGLGMLVPRRLYGFRRWGPVYSAYGARDGEPCPLGKVLHPQLLNPTPSVRRHNPE